MGRDRNFLYFLLTWVIMVILVAVSVVLNLQTSARITDNTDAISTLRSQATSLQNQLTSANSQISTLGSQLTTANSDIAALKNQVTTHTSQIATANGQVASLSAQLNSTNAQITAVQSQDSSFATQMSALLSQVTTLTSQVTTLQTTVNSLGSASTTLFLGQAVSQGANTYSGVYSYTPTYSGYLTISGSSSSTTGYILLVNSTTGGSATYPFGTGTTIMAGLTSGYSYGIYFGNYDSSGTITASLTGTYHQ
jgi:uncharacterized protein YlxW (UPF0749 family)